jgi:rhodanese-related sulfurtransferase
MTDRELRKCLKNAELLEEEPFDVLQEISYRINDAKRRRVGIEMLMRAIEHRDRFEGLNEILDSMLRAVGLFPYIAEPDDLPLRDRFAYEYHRPLDDEQQTVFHRVQGEVYRSLINGESLILSAPTSFGKSKVVDHVIAQKEFKNVAIVVPTLALIDETRRRISKRFSGKYKVVTHSSQDFSENNIFVLTPERVVAIENLPKIDFFVIDEFYKLGVPFESDADRTVILNQAFYKLSNMNGQFYLLGPSIDRIPNNVAESLNCRFVATDYSTVVTEQIRVKLKEDESNEEALVRICGRLKSQTLIYCASPTRAAKIARLLVENDIGLEASSQGAAASWIGENYSNEWILPIALDCGIGIHHGRIPRSLAQYTVREFNKKNLRFLICTSSLIEGVNTNAKNIVIFNKKVARKNFDFFTFNNIVGRSGRMFEHFVGRVFLFHDPPERELPFVEFPFLNQKEAPNSLLIHLNEGDLAPASAERIKNISSNDFLPIEAIKKNSPIEPNEQIRLAQDMENEADESYSLLSWTGLPKYKQLQFACDLIWEYLAGERPNRGGVNTAKQLAFKIWQLRKQTPYPDLIAAELTGKYKVKNVDVAVDRVFDFERTWATYHFPRLLGALDVIQTEVFEGLGMTPGDYSFFISNVESLYTNSVFVLLDELGLPLPLFNVIGDEFEDVNTIDEAISRIIELDLKSYDLDPFEKDLLENCRAGLGRSGR